MGKHQNLDFEAEAAMSLKVGDRVVFIHDDMPPFSNEVVEKDRIKRGHRHHSSATIVRAHGDGTFDLQPISVKDGDKPFGRVYEHVTLGSGMDVSNTFRVIQ